MKRIAMKKFLILFIPGFALATPTNLKVVGVTPTQAVISYTAPSTNPCTIQVSESITYSPVVNDVNETFFTGSSSDTYSWNRTTEGLSSLARAVSGTGVAGTRVVVIGRRAAKAVGSSMKSLALAADTAHYARVTCDGGASSTSFRTSQISGIPPADLPWDSAAHGNWAVPDFDWTDKTKAAIDPQTGAKIYRLSDPQELGFLNTVSFLAAFNGTGWTNLANLNADPVGAVATSGTTNYAFLPMTSNIVDYQFNGGFGEQSSHALSNFGVTLYGNASDTSGSNSVVNMCLSVDSGQSCYTSLIQKTLLAANSTYTTAPPSFPSAGYAGWSKPIPREYLPKWGTANVSGTTMTMLTDSNNNWSRQLTSPEWVAGVKIFVTGSSPTCTNNLCTVSAVTSATTVTLVESVTLSGVAWYSENLGVMVAKETSTGTVSISAQSKVAGYIPTVQGSNNYCSEYTVTANVDAAGNAISPGVQGRLCLISRYLANPEGDARYLYFVGVSTPDFRLLSPLRAPYTISGVGANDVPKDILLGNGTSAFPTATPNVFAVSWPSINSSSGCGSALACPTLFKLTYTGDYRSYENLSYSRLHEWATPATDPVTWQTVNTAVNALSGPATASTGCPTAFWGAPTLDFRGMNGTTAVFIHGPFAQDYGYCVFEFDIATGVLNQSFNTFDSSVVRNAGLHSIAVNYGIYSLDLTSLSIVGSARTSGPYKSTATHVFKSGAANANTSLPWPPDSSYDNTCPAGLPASIQAIGGTDGSPLCVKFRFPNASFCNSSPKNSEEVTYPCPSNAAFSGRAMEVGDRFSDPTIGDGEQFTVAAISGNDVTAIRDTGNGYACQSSPASYLRGRNCVASAFQATHVDDWVQYRGAVAARIWVTPGTGTSVDESGWLTRGHTDIDLQGSNYNYLGVAGFGEYYYIRTGTSSAFGQSSNLTHFSKQPVFSNTTDDISEWIQSYISAPGRAAAGNYQYVAADWRHINSPNGDGGERPGQVIGTVISTFTLQGGTTGVYKVAPISGAWVRSRPLFIYVGQYVLRDKSNATLGNTLTDADTWRYCYALNAGECRSGSAAGDLYIVAPLAQNQGRCWGSQMSQRNVCVWSSESITSQIMQLQVRAADPEGGSQRSIGFGLTRPGAQYVYSKARVTNDGKKILATVHHLGGWYTGIILIDPGSFDSTSTNGTQFIPIKVKASENIYVEFGYDSNFHCSSRQEVCRVNSSTIQSTPWKYAGESGSATQTTTTVTIPAISGRVLYYRVVGTSTGSTQVLAVP